MLRALLRLTWLEIMIFTREPLGAFGSVLVPVIVYVWLGRTLAPKVPQSAQTNDFIYYGAPVFAAVLIMITSVLSLVTIIAIYREGGILKRLRATPLRPWTILTAPVPAKLLFTASTLILTMLAGKRY